MQVKDVMKRAVKTCAPENNLAEVARIMWDYDCGVVPVVKADGTVAGVITDRDICIAAATRDKKPSQLLAQELMSPKIYACDAEADVRDVLKIMRAAKVRRLPVVAPEGRLQGILSMDDIVLRAEGQGPGPAVSLSYEDTVETLKEIYSHH